MVVVEMVAGDQVPAMPLLDVGGKLAGVAFWQYGPRALKVGVTFGFTVMDICAVVAQPPNVGVKV